MEKKTFLTILIALALVFSLIGCGDGVNIGRSSGMVTVAIKDAPMDEIALFEVDVLQIELKTSTGSTVTTLPKKQRINFAELTEMSEVLAGTNIPVALYTSAVLTLDFSNAMVQLTNEDTPAVLVDEEGSPLTGTIDVPLSFKGSGPKYIYEDRNALFVFDLDLNSSLQVDRPVNTVSFSPVISCFVDPSDANELIVHGRLMDPPSDSSVIEVGIWNIFEGEFLGTYKIATDSATVFHVNGAVYNGQDGVNAVNGLLPGARVWAHGTMNAGRTMLNADFVVGGWGVVAGDEDCVQGVIIGRTGGADSDAVLTIRGRGYDRETNLWTYRKTWTVNVSNADTRVVKWMSMEDSLDTNQLNVGQRVRIFGEITALNLDASTPGDGLARVLKNDLLGYAAGPVSGGTLTVDVVKIGYRPVEIYNFDVDGTVVADPTAFIVDTGALSPAVNTNDVVRVRGYVAPLSAVEPVEDYNALTVMTNENLPTVIAVQYLPGEFGAVSILSETGITLDITNALAALVDEGLLGVTALSASPAPSVVPAAEAGLYRILSGGVVTGYTDFQSFYTDLESLLGSGLTLNRVVSLGQYDAGSQELSAIAITVWVD